MTNNESILFFDGLCNLCVGSIQFVLKHEKKSDSELKFSSLQSNFGISKRKELTIPESVDSLVLLKGGQVYYYSSAALRLTSFMGGFWPLLKVLLIIPPFLRDSVYRFIAKHRYSWFGEREICWLPTPELESRFIN